MQGLSSVLAHSVAILWAEPRQERPNPTVLSRPLGSEAAGGLNPAANKTTVGHHETTAAEPMAIAALVATLCGGMDGVRLGLAPWAPAKVLPQDSPADVVAREAAVAMFK